MPPFTLSPSHPLPPHPLTPSPSFTSLTLTSLHPLTPHPHLSHPHLSSPSHPSPTPSSHPHTHPLTHSLLTPSPLSAADIKELEKNIVSMVRGENADVKSKNDHARLSIQHCQLAIINTFAPMVHSSDITDSPLTQVGERRGVGGESVFGFTYLQVYLSSK